MALRQSHGQLKVVSLIGLIRDRYLCEFLFLEKVYVLLSNLILIDKNCWCPSNDENILNNYIDNILIVWGERRILFQLIE